jgi:hypothetical protein
MKVRLSQHLRQVDADLALIIKRAIELNAGWVGCGSRHCLVNGSVCGARR